MDHDISYNSIIWLHGNDILLSPNMQREKLFLQHGTVSVYEHSFAVARLCLVMAFSLHIQIDERSLVRGALLHDYFLYDWHIPDRTHRWHGFTHARCALENALKEFPLGKIEKDMIETHMFPLGLNVPRYRESFIICIADKICASCETLSVMPRKP